MPSTPSDATSARRLSYSSRQAGQPTRWARSPGIVGVGVTPGEIELDEAIELVEALVASDLGRRGAEKPPDHLIDLGTLGHRSPSARCCRSLRRASCSVL